MTGRYKAYPKYQNTDIGWLGKVPSHWTLVPCRSLVEHIVEKNHEGRINNYLSLMANVGVIRYEDKGDVGNKKPDDLTKCKIVRKGQLVINSMNYAIGSYGMSPYDGVCSPVYIVLEAKRDVFLNRFALRVFENTPFQKHLATFGNGILEHRAAISWDDIKGQYIPLPPKSEQEKILSFLDHETAKIDTLIAKQEKLIELLKEKRQAVISHAVTKGLNPQAPMRDSGVEWLGEVPEHWFVVPIKRMCEVKDGTHDTPKYVDKGENSFPLITSKDFEGKNISFESAKYISKEAHREIVKRSNTEVGDVLMSMIGGNIGKALIVKETAEFSIKNVALFKTTRKSALASYILYYLESGLLDIQISLQSRGGAQGFLSLGDLRNLVFFKVPEDELNTIVEHLDLKIFKYDRLINIASDKIALLSERKTALISAVVTGKIDVRDFVSEQGQPQGVQG